MPFGNKPVTKANAVIAIFIALAADGAQLFLNAPLALLFGIGAEAADVVIDVVAAVLVTGLLGFSPLLLPTFILEAVPLADAFPTWTACVLYLIWQRRKPVPLPPTGS